MTKRVRAHPIGSFRSSRKELGGRVALVADSSAHTAELFGRALRSAGVGTLVANSCSTTLEHLRICRVDLLILDLELPHGRAYRVLEGMRSDPRHADTRAIVVAAANDAADRWMAMLAGADAFLLKPVRASVLLETAAELLPYRPPRGIAIA